MEYNELREQLEGLQPQLTPTFVERAIRALMRQGEDVGGGINATRLWLCSWGIGIEGSRPDDYRLDDAWRLDHILARARERGIYIQLCLDNFYDLSAKEKADTNPYLAQSGGPCQAAADFFSSPEARAQHRRRLDYLVARFAPYASLLAWELCNEMDYATVDRREPALLAWARDTAGYLKKHDPYGHATTTSLGIASRWPELWEAPELDMAQAHAYIHRPVHVRDRAELDAAALVLKQADEHAACGKPLLVAEFGFLGTKDFNPLNDADKMGVHVHNAIWASALSGCAGTAMSWWWDSYLPEHDLYYHYAALNDPLYPNASFFFGDNPENRSCRWVIQSNGPDGNPDVPSWQYPRYDPTNGTVSLGNVLRLGP